MSFPQFARPKEPSLDRILKDSQNPMSVLNLVPNEVAACIMAIPDDLVDITEEDLEKKLPDPDASTLQLRIMFWREYDRAMELRMKMDMARVYTGVMTRVAFYKFIKNHQRFAWVVNPPKNYLTEMEEMHTAVMKQLRDIIKLPNTNSMGFVDTKLADTKLRIMIALDMRMRGGYVHRSMQITQNLNKNETSITYSDTNSSGKGSDDIDEQLAMLEEEIKVTEARMLENKTVGMPDSVLLKKQQHLVDRVGIEDAEFVEVKSLGGSSDKEGI